MSTADSDKKAPRSSSLEKILEVLEKEDTLFALHVPQEVRETYGNNQLISHLLDTYSATSFKVEDSALIEKYARRGDLVVKKGDYHSINGRLPKDTTGVVRGIVKDGRISVATEKYDTWNVVRENLIVLGRVGGLFKKAKDWPETPALLMNVERGDLVRYVGEEITSEPEYRYTVPDRTEGIVVEKWRNPVRLDIVWLNGEGVHQAYYRYDNMTTNSAIVFRSESVVLYLNNNINIDKLLRECGLELYTARFSDLRRGSYI